MHASTPLLIAFKGHPGVGKSAVARTLSRRLSVPLIDKDDIKDIIDGICADPGGLAYDTMFNIGRRQLLQGLSVICDSPLSDVKGYTSAKCVANDAAAHLVVVECVCSLPEEWQRRIERRAALRLPAHHITTWDTLGQHLERRGASSQYAIDAPYLLIDTIIPVERIVEGIVDWLERGCPPVNQPLRARLAFESYRDSHAE